MRIAWKIVMAAAGVSAAVSCYKGSPDLAPLEETVLSQAVLDSSVKMREHLIADSEEFLHAANMLVYNDSLMIVVNTPRKDIDCVEIQSLKERKRLASFIKMGNGPGEVLKLSSFIQDSLLVLWDFVRCNIYVVNLEQGIRTSDFEYSEAIPSGGDVPSQGLVFWSGDSILFLNPYFFEDKDLRISNGQPPFVIQKIGQRLRLDLGVNPMLSYNVFQGALVLNKEKDRLFFASDSKDCLSMFDTGLKYLKRISGPVKLVPRYSVHDNSLSYKGKVPYAYSESCASEDCFWLIFHGQYDVYKPDAKKVSYIMRFDWDGNLQKTYRVNQIIYSITKSDLGEDVFYVHGWEDGLVKLWKLSPEVGSD